MAVHYPSYPAARRRPLPAIRPHVRPQPVNAALLGEIAACAAFGLFVAGMLLAFSALMAAPPGAIG